MAKTKDSSNPEKSFITREQQHDLIDASVLFVTNLNKFFELIDGEFDKYGTTDFDGIFCIMKGARAEMKEYDEVLSRIVESTNVDAPALVD